MRRTGLLEGRRKSVDRLSPRDYRFIMAKAAVFLCCLAVGAVPAAALWYLGLLNLEVGFLTMFSSIILTLVLYFSLGCKVLRTAIPDYLARLRLGEPGHAGETAVMAIFCNFLVHLATLLVVGLSLNSILLISASALFFTYPLYYLVTLLWGLQTEVRAVASGKLRLNSKFYANVVRRVRSHEEYLPITISLPVHTESNEVIFETIYNCQKALAEYRTATGQKANLVVSDDGLARMLGGKVTEGTIEACLAQANDSVSHSKQSNSSSGSAAFAQAAERIIFYRNKGISFVARPAKGRRGKFKKGGNLNYTYGIAWQIAQGATPESLFAAQGIYADGYAEGDIRIHELICLLDKDSGLEAGVLAATSPEFAADQHLGFTQHTTRAANGSENYFTSLQAQFTNMVYRIALPCKALQGLQVHLMGHSAFLRRDFLEATGGWAEDRVSEDYAKAMDAYSNGWHGKYIDWQELAFTEQVCSSFVEESGKQLRYCYGISEVVLGGKHRLTPALRADMIIYYLSYFNLAAALPVIVALLLTYQIYYLCAGMFINVVLFLVLPVIQGWMLGPSAGFTSRASTVRYFVLVALAYLGYTYSMLRGYAVYLTDRFRRSYETFNTTSVEKKEHSFSVGLSLLRVYIRQNTPVMIAWLLIAFGCVLLLQDVPPHIIRPLLVLFLMAHVLAPALLTPQLFARPRFVSLPKPQKAVKAEPQSKTGIMKHLSSRATSFITELLG